MARRESFLLRSDPALLEALRKWADDELRSMNGQIEFLLRRALREAGRLPPADSEAPRRPRGRRAGGGESPQSP